jgi:hypothetical protein
MAKHVSILSAYALDAEKCKYRIEAIDKMKDCDRRSNIFFLFLLLNAARLNREIPEQ